MIIRYLDPQGKPDEPTSDIRKTFSNELWENQPSGTTLDPTHDHKSEMTLDFQFQAQDSSRKRNTPYETRKIKLTEHAKQQQTPFNLQTLTLSHSKIPFPYAPTARQPFT